VRSGRSRFLFPLLLLGVVVVAGCGSSSSSTSSTGNAAAAATTSTSASATSSAAADVTVTTKHNDKLGTVLAAGDKKLTVYLFESDKGTTSTCSGACATAWPPVIGKGAADGKVKPAQLGTIKRADGTVQLTYHGHPLYYYAKDKDDEDAYGQGVKQFGADWYVLAPSGNKVDES
jgi:predicted lipoprotein with Yx(FWY)xxD motif